MPLHTPIHNDCLEELRTLLGERFSTSLSDRDQHGKDESFHTPYPPEAVAYARTTEEVSDILKICHRYKAPVIPFGTGTSLEGQIAALEGGVSIDLTQMNRVLETHVEDLDCRVQAGVTRKQLNKIISKSGLFFPVDPGADASLGGMVATRASGTNAVRYGTIRENVLGLTVVLSDGRIVQTGGRARKSAAGYDLTHLFCGSEGTLAIITEIQLRLYGIPEAISAAVCSFPTLEAAVNTVIPIIQLGIPVARIELLDEVQMDAINKYSHLDYPVLPTIFFEFHGTEQSVSETARMVGGMAKDNGAENFRWTTKQEERTKLWQARHDAYYAAIALKPGATGWPTDVCVPISRLAECILETKKEIDDANLLAPLVGHVGDGNFHLIFLVDPDNSEELEKAHTVNHRMVMRAIEMGGTCTGEHGIGHGKLKYMKREHGDAITVMAQVKKALDPENLLNPGKIIPS
ncbi:MAG: FAD-binding protein [SAR324 cluster bacterium]|nr:FAD-binding protein [SAR324 cluster bacterium]